MKCYCLHICLLIFKLCLFLVAPCDQKTCENGATCEIDGSEAVCICIDGYYGDRCQRGKLIDLHSFASASVYGSPDLVWMSVQLETPTNFKGYFGRKGIHF